MRSKALRQSSAAPAMASPPRQPPAPPRAPMPARQRIGWGCRHPAWPARRPCPWPALRSRR
eukprot:1708378-Lingulodinium_polyedra.AAC.1